MSCILLLLRALPIYFAIYNVHVRGRRHEEKKMSEYGIGWVIRGHPAWCRIIMELVRLIRIVGIRATKNPRSIIVETFLHLGQVHPLETRIRWSQTPKFQDYYFADWAQVQYAEALRYVPTDRLLSYKTPLGRILLKRPATPHLRSQRREKHLYNQFPLILGPRVRKLYS